MPPIETTFTSGYLVEKSTIMPGETEQHLLMGVKGLVLVSVRCSPTDMGGSVLSKSMATIEDAHLDHDFGPEAGARLHYIILPGQSAALQSVDGFFEIKHTSSNEKQSLSRS